MGVVEVLTKIGSFAGLVTLIWKIVEERNTYLILKVETKKVDGEYSVLTQIQNSNKIAAKKIDNAFLIISPENESLIPVGQRIAQRLHINEDFTTTNDFKKLFGEESIYIDKEVVFIPLSFYYSENVDIADEQLTYRCSVDKEELAKGTYSVRFYLFGEDRLHRSTQDLLVIS